MVARGQIGIEKKLDLKEGGHLISGGSFADALWKTETVIITN